MLGWKKHKLDSRLPGEISITSDMQMTLGRKVMTNLDSILENRDITLGTKFHIVKAIVFPVVT